MEAVFFIPSRKVLSRIWLKTWPICLCKKMRGIFFPFKRIINVGKLFQVVSPYKNSSFFLQKLSDFLKILHNLLKCAVSRPPYHAPMNLFSNIDSSD
jgi:hypothetical protein